MSSATSPSASRMIEPLPNCFSICASAAARAFCRSLLSATKPLLPSSIAASARHREIRATRRRPDTE